MHTSRCPAGLKTADIAKSTPPFCTQCTVFSALSIGQVSIAADVRSKLFDTFITSLATTKPQTELLYGSAALLQAGAMEIASKVTYIVRRHTVIRIIIVCKIFMLEVCALLLPNVLNMLYSEVMFALKFSSFLV